MKVASIILGLVIIYFLVSDIVAINSIRSQLESPLIPVNMIEKLQRPFIILAIAEAIISIALAILIWKKSYKPSVVIASISLMAIIVTRQYCLLCAA